MSAVRLANADLEGVTRVQDRTLLNSSRGEEPLRVAIFDTLGASTVRTTSTLRSFAALSGESAEVLCKVTNSVVLSVSIPDFVHIWFMG
jgi:hypothetical protein